LAEWVIADTHFSHHNIITYESRPFENIDVMDQTMIENWNRVVKPDDTIYHLGDVIMANKTKQFELLPRLNGNKILILGNHDLRVTKTRWRDLGFSEVLMEKFHEGLWMTHYPQETEKVQERIQKGEILGNLHGHVHSKIHHLDQDIYKCVSVEHTSYAPILLEDVIRGFKKKSR